MKMSRMILLALFAVFAFSAVAVATASAEITLLAEWLLNGAAVTVLTAVETKGLITLSTLVFGITGVAVDCEGSFDGSVGPNGEDEITSLLNTAGEEISKTPLTGLSLSCTVTTVVGSECTAVGTLAELWPHNLPWHTNLELMENGSFLDHLFGGGTEATEPGYEVVCTNGKENLCLGLTSSTQTNGETDVIGIFDATSEKAKCTTGEGDITGEGLTVDLAGGTLAVSSV